MLPNASWTAMPRARPDATGLLQFAISATFSRTALCRGFLTSSWRRSSKGSFPAAAASSSKNASVTYPLTEFPTDRQKP